MSRFGGTSTRAYTRTQARGATPELRRVTDTTSHGLSAGRHSTQTTIGSPSLCDRCRRRVQYSKQQTVNCQQSNRNNGSAVANTGAGRLSELGLYRILLLPIIANSNSNSAWHVHGAHSIQTGGRKRSRILFSHRAIVLHQGGQCRWAGAIQG